MSGKKFLLVFIVTSLFITAYGAENNMFSTIQSDFETKVKTFYQPIKDVAFSLFWILATIEMVIIFSMMILRQELEIGAIFAQLVKLILIFGLFQAFFMHPEWMFSIFNGFNELAFRAGGSSASVDTLIDNLFAMWEKIGNQSSIFSPADAILFGLIGLVATIALTVLAAQALMIYAFLIFSIYIGVFFLAFGSFSHTRAWAINAITTIIRWGAKWFMILLLISISFSLVNDALMAGFEDLTSLIKLLIISFMMVTISTGISSFVDSYFNGMGSGENNAGYNMARNLTMTTVGVTMGAVTGGVGGAVNARNSIALTKASGAEAGSEFSQVAQVGKGFISGASKGALDAFSRQKYNQFNQKSYENISDNVNNWIDKRESKNGEDGVSGTIS
jgi:P-type conjugative transfer protein TrbL